jgi:hypothetical protein
MPAPQLTELDESRLHDALAAATAAFARLGFTPDAFAETDEEERAEPLWADVLKVWAAAGVPHPTPSCVLRYARGSRRGERTFFTPEAALAAAIEAIETNEMYPQAIEVDGTRVMDTAAILHAWEERHNPA